MSEKRLKRLKEKVGKEDLPGMVGLLQELISFLKAGGGCRNRTYTAIKTFWLFLYQILSGNCSCLEVVIKDAVSSFIDADASGNSGYCKARGRLVETFLLKILKGLTDCFAVKSEERYL